MIKIPIFFKKNRHDFHELFSDGSDAQAMSGIWSDVWSREFSNEENRLDIEQERLTIIKILGGTYRWKQDE